MCAASPAATGKPGGGSGKAKAKAKKAKGGGGRGRGAEGDDNQDQDDTERDDARLEKRLREISKKLVSGGALGKAYEALGLLDSLVSRVRARLCRSLFPLSCCCFGRLQMAHGHASCLVCVCVRVRVCAYVCVCVLLWRVAAEVTAETSRGFLTRCSRGCL